MALIPEGDVDRQTTFAAVGQALTAWEQAEWALAELFSVLAGEAGSLQQYRTYGQKGRIFQDRIKKIRDAAEIHFRRLPNQDLEGEVRACIDMADRLSATRHQIAHGIVEEIAHSHRSDDNTWPPERHAFHLCAPWYVQSRLKTPWPGYGSAEILGPIDIQDSQEV